MGGGRGREEEESVNNLKLYFDSMQKALLSFLGTWSPLILYKSTAACK